MNIGVHFFDMLAWLFGPLERYTVTKREDDMMSGRLILQNADVEWLLSTSLDHVPPSVREKGQRVYRMLKMGEDSFDFSSGFDNLHTRSYAQIIEGNGFTVEDARQSIELVYRLRTCDLNKDHRVAIA
jgi:UDP-N-acetyl-2-amino-2-deoxyglucuronate dehydrogenase